MDAIQLIAASFRDVQSALHEDLADVDDELFWWQAREGYSHIGFLAWHVIRDEDVVVSHVTGAGQLWTGAGWHARLGMDARDQGTGLDPGRLATFRYDRPLFMEYAGAVWERTPKAIATLAEGDLDRPAWPGSDWTIARQLVEGCIGHTWEHLGEIRAIRGLRGWRFRE